MRNCPFCNSIEVRVIDFKYNHCDCNFQGYAVNCDICQAQGPLSKTKELAIKKWNGLLLKTELPIDEFNKLVNEDAMGGVSAPMATLNNTPGMGNVTPGSSTTNNIGSGDKWGQLGKIQTQGLKTKKKKVYKKIKEQNVNPFDKIGNAMLKKAKVPAVFKKGPKGTVKTTSKKYKIKPLAEYMQSSNISETNIDKKYKIKISRSGTFGNRYSDMFVEGTLAELINHFAYTLEVGKSWEHEKGNKKIDMNPKTIEKLITNVENAKDNSAANGYGGYSLEVVEETNVNEVHVNMYNEFDSNQLIEDLYITLLYRIPDDTIKYEANKSTSTKYAEKYLDKVEPLFDDIKKYPISYKVYFKDGTIINASKMSRWVGDWIFELDGVKYDKYQITNVFKEKFLTKIERLEYELKHHDWYYEYSDDHSVWQTGVKHGKLLSALSKELREEGFEKEVQELWNKYAPKQES